MVAGPSFVLGRAAVAPAYYAISLTQRIRAWRGPSPGYVLQMPKSCIIMRDHRQGNASKDVDLSEWLDFHAIVLDRQFIRRQ